MSPFASFLGVFLCILLLRYWWKYQRKCLYYSCFITNTTTTNQQEKKIADKIYFYVFYVYVLCWGCLYHTEQNETRSKQNKNRKMKCFGKCLRSCCWYSTEGCAFFYLFFTLQKLVPQLITSWNHEKKNVCMCVS